jgi:hypothetical protein
MTIPVYFEWLSPGELPCFNALNVEGKAVNAHEANLYFPRTIHSVFTEKPGWHRKKGSGNCSILTAPLGDLISKKSIFQYVHNVAQRLSPKGGSFLVIMRENGDEVSVGIVHIDFEGRLGIGRNGEPLSDEEREMGLRDEIVLDDPGCPGKDKCHGCMQWCDKCGDVDFTCDFPDCDVHQRLSELEKELRYLKEQTARLAQEWRDSEKETGELQETVDRARREEKRGQKMVPRQNP